MTLKFFKGSDSPTSVSNAYTDESTEESIMCDFKRIKAKFKVNDIVLTKRNTLAIIKQITYNGYIVNKKRVELASYSINFISTIHTKDLNREYNAWHDEEELKLVARTNTLNDLIKSTKLHYEKFNKQIG